MIPGAQRSSCLEAARATKPDPATIERYVINPPQRLVPRVLFFCERDATLSEMAVVFLEMQARVRANIHSAGSGPAAELERGVVEVMAEVSADNAYPILPGKRYLD